MTLNIALDPEFFADVLTTAVEGGVGYWLELGSAQMPLSGPDGPYTLSGFFDAETGEPFTADLFLPGFALPTGPVSVELIERGIQQLFAPGVLPRRNDLRASVLSGDAGQIDASDADAIFQLGLFGQLIFG